MDRGFRADGLLQREWGIDGRANSPNRDRAIAALVARQHGVVTRRQLMRAGFSGSAIDSRARRGRLRLLHTGVYLVGPIAAPLARPMAAVLACGEGARLSHRSAAALWALGPYSRDAGPIDVTVVARDCRRPGIRAHRVRTLAPDEATTLQHVPITTPTRTLLDLASLVPERELEAALAEAERRRLTNRRYLLALIARYPGRPGTPALQRLLKREIRPTLTRSEAENRFLALIGRARLPPPEVNIKLGPHEVDFLWREQGLIVEVDGFAHHSDRAAFERDRRRDAELAARGYTVIRVTWRQLVDESAAVVARVAQALARAGGGGRLRSA